MPSKKKQKPEPSAPPALPESGAEGATEVETIVAEPENGQGEHAAGGDSAETTEEPAKMRVQIEGTAGAVRAAARKVGNTPVVPRVTTPASDPEAPEDNTDELLTDPRNMVVVQRQLPRKIVVNGEKIRTGMFLPEPYPCPTTVQEIEDDVFENFGGYKYKCTIHPNTPNGKNTLLGAFTIEHPDGPDTMPIIDGLEESIELPMDPRTSAHTSGADSTMRDTDPFKKMREDAELRLERAKAKKDALMLEAEAKKLEEEISNIGKPAPQPVASSESEELRKLREQLAEKDRLLAEKKTNDRFDKLEATLATVTQTLATIAQGGGAKSGPSENDILLKMLTQSQQHSKDMLAMIQSQNKPAPPSDADNFDKFLNRFEKLQLITGQAKGGGGNRLSELETRLIDMSVDRLMGGGDDDDGGGSGGDGVDVNDAIKTAIKEFGPIAKTYVEKTITAKQAENGGNPLSQEQLQQISSDGAAFATKKIQDDLALQGLELRAGPENRLIVVPVGVKQPVKVPPRANPGTRVVSEARTPGGVVKKIAVEPADLSKKKPAPAAAPAPAPTATEKEKEGTDVKYGEFPMLGENGSALKIPLPVTPGEMKYNRKESVDFVLAGILSELRQGYPKKAENKQYVESFVAADAIEYLDDQLLDQLEKISDGPELEKLLQGAGGDVARIAEIKKAGDDEVVAGYIRRTILTIQREWAATKAQNANNK